MIPPLIIKKTLLKQAESLPQGTPIGKDWKRNIASQKLTKWITFKISKSSSAKKESHKKWREGTWKKKNFKSTMNPWNKEKQ